MRDAAGDTIGSGFVIPLLGIMVNGDHVAREVVAVASYARAPPSAGAASAMAGTNRSPTWSAARIRSIPRIVWDRRRRVSRNTKWTWPGFPVRRVYEYAYSCEPSGSAAETKIIVMNRE